MNTSDAGVRRAIWQKRAPRQLSYYLNVKMADYLSRRAVALAAVRKSRQMAIFANDYIGILVNQFGYFEYDELLDLFEFLAPLHQEFKQGSALDIGANIGNHTLFFSDYFRWVHAFEPNPRTYELLKFNTAQLPNVVTHAVGLGDTDGNLQLLPDIVHPGVSSMKFGPATPGQVVSVPVRRLDGFNGIDADVCFIKMDVEGFEENVLRGAREVLARHQPLIVLEQHESEFSAGASPSVSFLATLGYAFCWQEPRRQSRYWLGRRMAEIWEVLRGRTCRFVSSQDVPSANYTMLIAVPPRFQNTLSRLNTQVPSPDK